MRNHRGRPPISAFSPWGWGGLHASVDAACSLLASTPKLNLALLTISGTSSKGCCGLGRTHYADMADTSVIARFLDAARTGRVDGTSSMGLD